MAGMLKLSDYEFKTTVMNMLRAKNKQNARIDGKCKQKDRNSKKVSSITQ